MRLAASMLAIQLSIGALNDAVDVADDAAQKPWKPIPAGLVGRGTAFGLAAVAGVVALVLSAWSGSATVLAAVGCLGLGYAYDLRLSRTALSWVPLALALPLLPIHAWLGSTGGVPPGLLTLVPAGVLAGAGLSLANGLVDVERDARTDRRGLTVRLGPAAAWLVQTGLLGIAAGLAVFVAPAIPGSAGASAADDLGGILANLRFGGVVVGTILLAAGSSLLRARSAGVRERGWELEAIAVACLGVAWLAGTAATTRGG